MARRSKTNRMVNASANDANTRASNSASMITPSNKSQHHNAAMGDFGKAPEKVAATVAAPAVSWAAITSGTASASASNPAVATPTALPMIPKTGNSGVSTASPLSMASDKVTSTAQDSPSPAATHPRPSAKLPNVVPAVPLIATNITSEKLYNGKPPSSPGVPSRPVVDSSKASGPPLSSIDKSMASIKAKMDEMKLARSGSSVHTRSGASTTAGSSAGQNRAQENKNNLKNQKGKGRGKEKGSPKEFGDLPPEVRVKIWRLAMDVPRIIEVEKGPVVRNGVKLLTNYPICGEHALHRVAPQSRLPPVFFGINYEAREQALKIYEKRSFDTREEAHDIYFNPRTDILYFGEKTCVSTLLNVFSSAVYDGLTIPRIAILCSGNRTKCCDWDDPAYGVNGGITIMESLHGFDKSIVDWNSEAQFSGCPGLKEVYWVTPSHLWEPAPGRLNPGFQSFRAPSTDGITKGQKNFKDRIKYHIERVENDLVVGNVGPNLWVGENKPTFEFVSLAPPEMAKTMETEGRVYEAFEISIQQHKYLGRRNFAAIIDIERRTGCDILLSKYDFPGEGREVGFAGDKDAVTKARKAIENRLAKMETT